MKKCPPGVICIENITMFFILVIFCVILYLFYLNNRNTNKEEKVRSRPIVPPPPPGIFQVPNIPYTNFPADVLQDPYIPPLKDDRYLVPEIFPRGPISMAINIPTNRGAVDTSYRQVGILTPDHGDNKNKILPLMGRPVNSSRQKWQYYTMSNQNHSVKLPIRIRGKSATNDYGVDELFSNDHVFVEGYNDGFKVTIYDNDSIRYII